MNGDRMEADHRRLDYRIFTDGEEVTLLPHKRDTEVPYNPDTDIRDRPEMTHNEKTGYFRRSPARPRQTDRERPPVINDRSGFWTWKPRGVWGPEDGSKRNPGPSAAAQTTDLTGGGGDDTTEGGGVRPLRLRVHHRGGGGVRPLSLRVHQGGREPCLGLFQRSVHGMVFRTGGRMLNRRQIYWLTQLLGCNRTWRVSARRTGC